MVSRCWSEAGFFRCMSSTQEDSWIICYKSCGEVIFTTQINLVSKLSIFFCQNLLCMGFRLGPTKSWITKKLDHFVYYTFFYHFSTLSLYKTQPTSHIYIKTTRIIPPPNLRLIPQISVSWKELTFLHTIIFWGSSNLQSSSQEKARCQLIIPQISCT